MTRPRARRRALLALPVAALLAASSASSEIRIGVAGPMTGRYAAFGAQMRAGAELAVADLNGRGGIEGEPVTLVGVDDGCDRTGAAQAAEELVRREIHFVVGHFCASASLAAAKIYAAAGALQMVPGMDALHPDNDALGPLPLFRLSGSSDPQGEALRRLLAGRLTGKRVAILHDRTLYGRAAATTMQQVAASAAVEVAFFEPIVAGEKDYGAVVARLKVANVDAVYFGGFPTEAALLVRQMRQAGVTATLIGPETLAAREYWDLAGAMAGATLVTFLPDESRMPTATDAAARLREKGVDVQHGLALRSYASVEAWAGAAKASGHLDASGIAAQLTSGPQATILGSLTFAQNGAGDLPAYAIYLWRDGSLKQAE